MKSSPDTKAKTLRNNNFRKLIDAIREKPLCYEDASSVLGMHSQSVRLYFQRLLEYHVIVDAGKVEGYRSKRRLWKITDEEAVSRFTVLMSNGDMILRYENIALRPPKKEKPAVLAKKNVLRVVRGLSRTVHQIKDDDEIPAKLKKGTHVYVQRDPLIEAFFGPARTKVSLL